MSCRNSKPTFSRGLFVVVSFCLLLFNSPDDSAVRLHLVDEPRVLEHTGSEW